MKIDKSLAIQAMFKDSTKDIGAFSECITKVRQLSFYDTIEFYFEGAQRDMEHARDMLESNGFKSVFLAAFPMKAGNVNIGDIDAGRRQAALDQVRQWVDRAYFYRSARLMVLSGKVYESREDNEKSFELTLEALKDICRYARERAREYVLDITLENFNDAGEPYLLIGPCKKALEVADRVKQEYSNFELTFDLSHMLQLREEPIEALSMLERHVNHIHLANCVIRDPGSPFYGDRHPPFGMEGGEVDTSYLCSFLAKAGESGFFKSKKGTVTIGVEIITPAGADAFGILNEATADFQKSMSCLSDTDKR